MVIKRRKRSSFPIMIIASVIMSLLFTGCKNPVNEEASQFMMYYMDSSETKLIKIPYEPIHTDSEKLIQEFINLLQADANHVKYKKAIPDSVSYRGFEWREDGQLTLYFDADYMSMPKTTEVLCRSAIVNTLCQVDAVEFVEFYINGQPLMNTNDKPIGLMKAEDFIDNTIGDTNYLQRHTMTLFFANKKGNALKETHLNVDVYNGSLPMEQLIIEQLIKGPEAIIDLDKEEFYKTMADTVQLNKVTVKNGVCTVDFNEKFLEKIDGITNEVAIYSVVNSLAEMTTINQVKFLINGEERKIYQDGFFFDVFFERNLDIVETSDN